VRYDEDEKRVVAEPLELAQVLCCVVVVFVSVCLCVGRLGACFSWPAIHGLQEFRRFEYASPWEQAGTGGTVVPKDI
jgi:hypothetical protein